jgi:hypothetical protein
MCKIGPLTFKMGCFRSGREKNIFRFAINNFMTLKEIGSKTAATPNRSIKNHPSRIRQRMKLSGYENAPIRDEKAKYSISLV